MQSKNHTAKQDAPGANAPYSGILSPKLESQKAAEGDFFSICMLAKTPTARPKSLKDLSTYCHVWRRTANSVKLLWPQGA